MELGGDAVDKVASVPGKLLDYVIDKGKTAVSLVGGHVGQTADDPNEQKKFSLSHALSFLGLGK